MWIGTVALLFEAARQSVDWLVHIDCGFPALLLNDAGVERVSLTLESLPEHSAKTTFVSDMSAGNTRSTCKRVGNGQRRAGDDAGQRRQAVGRGRLLSSSRELCLDDGLVVGVPCATLSTDLL